MTSTQRFAATTRAMRAVLPPVTQGRVVLLGMASVLLLSGCMLSPLFQAPALVLTGISVLLGLAACGGGAGGGGGGGTTTTTTPTVFSLNGLSGHPERGGMLVGNYHYGDGRYSSYAGASIAIGPSVQGDGFDSLVIGAPNTTRYAYYTNGKGAKYLTSTYNGAGAVYVVFGSSTLSNLWTASSMASLSTLSNSNGFTIAGMAINGDVGYHVGIAPDMNGDGLAEVLVSDPSYGNNGYDWVVYGSATPATKWLTRDTADFGAYALATNGSQGFAIGYGCDCVHQPYFNGPLLGADINGDGVGDVVVAYAHNAANEGTARLYTGLVMHLGQSENSPTNGYLNLYDYDSYFRGEYYGDENATSVAKGSLNGDTFDDLVVGAPQNYAYIYDIDAESNGVVHVVFGSGTGIATDEDPYDLLGSYGFTLVNSDSNYSFYLGTHVGTADINGDGIDDIIATDVIYQYDSQQAGYVPHGRVWVVFGTATPNTTSQLDLAAVAADPTLGFSVTLPRGVRPNAVAGAKMNASGPAALLIGAPYAGLVTPAGEGGFNRYSNGAVYVVFGGSSLTSISTSQLNGTNGFTVLGAPQAYIGYSLAAGNLNGDTHDDIAIGAPYDSNYDYSSSTYIAPGGAVYVVFGGDTFTGSLPAVTIPSGAYVGRYYSTKVVSGPPAKIEGDSARTPAKPDGRSFLMGARGAHRRAAAKAHKPR